MAHNVAVQGLGEGVLHPFPLGQADHAGFLSHHVHHHIGGQTLAPVGKPFDEVGVGNGGDPHRPALVVDLHRLLGGVLKLADHVAEGTHLPVAQVLGAVPVQGGDLVKGNLADILGKGAVLHSEQVPVGSRPEDGQRDDLTHQSHHHQQHHKDAHRQALLLDKAEVVSHPGLARGLAVPEAGGHQGRGHIGQTQHKNEAVKVRRLQIDSGQAQIEVDKAYHRRHQQVDEDLARFAQVFPGLFSFVIQVGSPLCGKIYRLEMMQVYLFFWENATGF